MSTFFKIILCTLAVFVGLILYNGMKTPSIGADTSSQPAEAMQSSAQFGSRSGDRSDSTTSVSSGWTNSVNTFRDRWNGMVKDAYQLQQFSNGRTQFLEGDISYSDLSQISHSNSAQGVFDLQSEHHSSMRSACGMLYAAAAGVSTEVGEAVAGAAIDNAKSHPGEGGLVDFDGHRMLFKIAQYDHCAVYEFATP